MIYRALILILILMACGAMPALCEGLNDIHYHIISSLDHAQMTLAEHVRVSFHADSLSTDSLLFWRAMIEKSCEMSIDSIFINNMRLDPLLEDHYMYMYSSNNDSSDQENDLDSLTYTLPMNDVVEGNVNTADFYYTIKYVGPSGVDEIFIPEAFTYGEYYPRLVHSADSISNHDQRYASFETFSFKLRMPRGLHFMSETEPNIAQFGNDAIEISIDSLRTAIFVWSAFPEKYYRHTSIGPVLFDIYIDPALELKEEELQDIADAMAFYGKQFSGIPYEKINVIFIALPGIIAGGAANNFIILPNGSNSSSFIEKIFDDINIYIDLMQKIKV